MVFIKVNNGNCEDADIAKYNIDIQIKWINTTFVTLVSLSHISYNQMEISPGTRGKYKQRPFKIVIAQ